MSEQPQAPRQLSWLPLAGAATAVTLIVVLTFVLGGGSNRGVGEVSKVDGNGALLCPDKKPPLGVPTDPHGVSTARALVPDAPIDQLVVCEYTSAGVLGGRKVVRNGLTAAQSALLAVSVPSTRVTTTTPAACATATTEWLVGAVYAKGYVWVDTVAAPCALTTNGMSQARTGAPAAPASTAYRTGTWPS